MLQRVIAKRAGVCARCRTSFPMGTRIRYAATGVHFHETCCPTTMAVTFYQWTSAIGAHGMRTPEALEVEGWERFSPSVRYPDSWLMRKPT